MTKIATINNRDYLLAKDHRQNDALRASFNELAKMTFNINFEKWYQSGYWQENYIPHSLVVDNQVVANVSVNLMQFNHLGSTKKMIQLGTVMTHPDHRGLGLSRLLIKQVLADYRDQADLLYLFANDSVLEFYPKFGFQKAFEYRYTLRPSQDAKPSPLQKLDMTLKESESTFLGCYAHGNPLSALHTTGGADLLMFYAIAGLKDHIYYLPEYDAVMMAEVSGCKMTLYEIFCKRTLTLADLYTVIPKGVEEVELGFTPKDTTGMDCAPLQLKDNTLFVLEGGDNIFEGKRLMFPLTSHA